MQRKFGVTAGLILAATMSACGGGSSAPATGPLTVHVADGPIDPALVERVCLAFTAITVHYAGGSEVRLDYDPLPSQVSPQTHCTNGSTPWNGTDPVPPVRLDALNGALTVALVDSLQIPVGRITWIRLHFREGSSITYIREGTGGEFALACPSCEITDNNQNRGFKLNRTFDVTSSGLAVLIDVDLGKSLYTNGGGYVLRPTARIELDDSLGTIAGDVHAQLITDLGGTAYTGTDVDTGCAVYLYPDDGSTLEDFWYDGADATDSNVIATAHVRYNGESGDLIYSYALGGLPGGTIDMPESYRIALTCDADDPDLANEGLTFTAAQTVDVVAGATTVAEPFAP
jgi:hypothetical protein